jgi:hypothetical protein
MPPMTEYQKKYYQEHREEILAKQRKWREEHPDVMTKYVNDWRIKNPERFAETNCKYQRKLYNDNPGLRQRKLDNMKSYREKQKAFKNEFIALAGILDCFE